MRTTLLIAASALCLLTGCMEYQITFANPEENYLTFNHPFTDSAIASVEAKATEMCAQRKQGVIQTSRACSLSKCTTNFQCVAQKDITQYGL